MAVHRRMRKTFVGADLAGEYAGMHLCLHKRTVGLGLPREKPGRGPADIGTIQIRPDTANQTLPMLGFSETGIGARGANLLASGQHRDGLGIGFTGSRQRTRVLVEHNINGFHRRWWCRECLPQRPANRHRARSPNGHRSKCPCLFRRRSPTRSAPPSHSAYAALRRSSVICRLRWRPAARLSKKLASVALLAPR